MTSLAAQRPAMRRQRPIATLKLGLALAAGAAVFGLLAGDLAATGHPLDVLGLAAVLLPVLMWRRPYLAPVFLLATALLIEQVGESAPAGATTAAGAALVQTTPNIPITSHIPLYKGISSLHIEGADLLLLTILVVFLVETGGRRWPRSHLAASILALICAVGLGIVIGLAHHGQLRVALMETRPYVYLASSFVFTAVLITSRRALRRVLWAYVLVVGFKAVQGIYVFLEVRDMNPRPESILGHEMAYFFAVFIFLVLALWLLDVPGRLRTTATWLLPLVIVANLANDRRAAWLLLAGGLLVLVAVTYRTVPSRRRAIRRGAIATMAFMAVYLPAFWYKTGALAQPARALHSVISADPRDAASNLYRVQENANLIFNIRQGGVVGKGFGVPIDYALPIVNIQASDPLIAYVPHNGVLYVLMRMGLLGAIAMWAMLATGIIAGCRLARSLDRELAVVGIVVACALVAYALEGAVDQGFFFYRIAFVTGAFLGLAEAARRMGRAARTATAPRAVES